MSRSKARVTSAPLDPPAPEYRASLGDYFFAWVGMRTSSMMPFLTPFSPLVTELQVAMSELTVKLDTMETSMADAKTRVQAVMDKVTALTDELTLLMGKVGDNTFTSADLTRIQAINDDLVNLAAAPLPPTPVPPESPPTP